MPPKRRRKRVSGLLPASFVRSNAAGVNDDGLPLIYPPGWEAAFKLFAEIAETGGVAEAIRIFDEVSKRARKTVVRPPPARQIKRERSQDPARDAELLGRYFQALEQGMTKTDALALIEPRPHARPALWRRLQRLLKHDK